MRSRTLGERESGTAKLEEAVAAYREALKEWTRERVPLDWAMSFGNQGVALMSCRAARGRRHGRDRAQSDQYGLRNDARWRPCTICGVSMNANSPGHALSSRGCAGSERQRDVVREHSPSEPLSPKAPCPASLEPLRPRASQALEGQRVIGEVFSALMLLQSFAWARLGFAH